MGVVPRCVERCLFSFHQVGEKGLLETVNGPSTHDKKEREKGNKTKNRNPPIKPPKQRDLQGRQTSSITAQNQQTKETD